MTELVHIGDFCPNKECIEYGKVQTPGHRNITSMVLASLSISDILRELQEKFCRNHRDSILWSADTDDEILKVLAHIAEGNRISSLTRTTGHKEDTS